LALVLEKVESLEKFCTTTKQNTGTVLQGFFGDFCALLYESWEPQVLYEFC
jgi:hypothetical protein